MDDWEDDGTADRAAEIAVGWIARAWYRSTHSEKGDAGKLMLRLANSARSHITAEQWKALGE